MPVNFRFVGKFIPRSERLRELGDAARKFTNVYVKNFGDEFEDDEFRAKFEQFGKVSRCIIMRADDGKSKGFGFAAFDEPEDAEQVICGMHTCN